MAVISIAKKHALSHKKAKDVAEKGEIAEKKDIKGELTDKLKAALEEFAGVFQAEPVEKAS